MDRGKRSLSAYVSVLGAGKGLKIWVIVVHILSGWLHAFGSLPQLIFYTALKLWRKFQYQCPEVFTELKFDQHVNLTCHTKYLTFFHILKFHELSLKWAKNGKEISTWDFVWNIKFIKTTKEEIVFENQAPRVFFWQTDATGE